MHHPPELEHTVLHVHRHHVHGVEAAPTCARRCTATATPRCKADQADSGAVTLIQRFGSAANLNIHLHCLVLDGVSRQGANGTPEYVAVPAPTDEALQAVLHKIITRTMGLLTRLGLLVEEQGQAYLADADSDEARALRPLQAAPGQWPGPSPGRRC